MKLWHIIHPLGTDSVDAETAREALQKAFVPTGRRTALAVFSAEIVAQPGADETRAFRAYIGTPLGEKVG